MKISRHRTAKYSLNLCLAALLLAGPGTSRAAGQSRPGGRTGGRDTARQQRTGGSRNAPAAQGELAAFKGTLRSITKNQLQIDLEGQERFTLVRNKKTRFFIGKKEVPAAELPMGSELTVEVRKELNGDLVAVNVIAMQAPSTP